MKRRGESKSKRDERVWVSLSPPPSSLAARSTTEHTPSMSNLIPSTLRTRSDSSPTPSSSSSSSDTSDTSPALSLPEHLYTDCQSCRVTGTLTFSAVGLYALTVSRVTAKTPVGKGAASLMGLGAHARPLCLVSSSTQIANTRPNALDRLPRRRSRALDRLLAPAALPLGRSAVVSRPLAPMPTPCCKLRSTQRLEVPHMGLEAAMDSRGPAPRTVDAETRCRALFLSCADGEVERARQQDAFPGLAASRRTTAQPSPAWPRLLARRAVRTHCVSPLSLDPSARDPDDVLEQVLELVRAAIHTERTRTRTSASRDARLHKVADVVARRELTVHKPSVVANLRARPRARKRPVGPSRGQARERQRSGAERAAHLERRRRAHVACRAVVNGWDPDTVGRVGLVVDRAVEAISNEHAAQRARGRGRAASAKRPAAGRQQVGGEDARAHSCLTSLLNQAL